MTRRVKICGLKDATHIQSAVSAGADLVGFVHYQKSPRHIELADISKLIRNLPKHVASVLVTVNPTDDWLDSIDFPVSYLQLHGDESPARVQEIKAKLPHIKIIKAIAVSNAKDIEAADAYLNCVDILLFDTKVENMHGGSGKTFDWSLLKNKNISMPWILSGGLNIHNIKEAISQTNTAIVDVSSGVESSAGVKDAALIKQFIEAVKN